jgi:hypothetical protein
MAAIPGDSISVRRVKTRFNLYRIIGLAIGLAAWFVGCTPAITNPTKSGTPPEIYTEVWTLIQERYALLEDKGVDWDQEYASNQDDFSSSMNEQTLFKQLADQLEVLRDGHVALLSPFDTSSYDGFYRPFPTNFNLDIVEESYLKGAKRIQGPFIYGVVDSVAYLYHPSFAATFTENDIQVIWQAISNAKGLVVDIRSNGGGSYRQVEALFAHFIQADTWVKSEYWKASAKRGDFLNPVKQVVKPLQPSYTKPIVLLTNSRTYSAANDFAWFMGDLPTVQVMGSKTGGGGGTPYRYALSNGWILQYTASRSLSPGGRLLEEGLVPDQSINITPIDEAQRRDPILEAAYRYLR